MIMRSFCINLRVLWLWCCDLTQCLCVAAVQWMMWVIPACISSFSLLLLLSDSPAFFYTCSFSLCHPFCLSGFNCRAVKPAGNSCKNPPICLFPSLAFSPSGNLSIFKQRSLQDAAVVYGGGWNLSQILLHRVGLFWNHSKAMTSFSIFLDCGQRDATMVSLEIKKKSLFPPIHAKYDSIIAFEMKKMCWNWISHFIIIHLLVIFLYVPRPDHIMLYYCITLFSLQGSFSVITARKLYF